MRILKYSIHASILALAVTGGYLLAQRDWRIGSIVADAAPSAFRRAG